MLDGAARDAEQLAYRVRHECAHSWNYLDHGDTPAAMLAIGYEGVEALAREEGWMTHAEASVALGERRADALALAWACTAAMR